MENKIIEIVELGYPQSIIQRENEPITELIETELLVEQLESRIKELENNTTELITEEEDYYGAMTNITKTKCCGIGPITNENFCPNCGRKIIKK